MNVAPVENGSDTARESALSWAANLECNFVHGGHRTIVRYEHFGPLRIQRPFYPESNVAHVYLLHPPGGVVGGDKLTVKVTSDLESAGLITTPGATKFYRSNGQLAEVTNLLESEGGSLEWFPQENIFYPDCKVSINSDVRLSRSASLAWWDINCFGRGESEKSFSQGLVSTSINLWSDNVLLLRESIRVNPELSIHMSSSLRGNTTIGTFLLHSVNEERISCVRQCLNHCDKFSVTAFDGLMIVRYLGNSAEQAKSGFIQVWTKLRHELNGKAACLPRIWAT